MRASKQARNARASMSTTILTHPRVSFRGVLDRGGGWIGVLALALRRTFLRCAIVSDVCFVGSGADGLNRRAFDQGPVWKGSAQHRSAAPIDVAAGPCISRRVRDIGPRNGSDETDGQKGVRSEET
jgi:hypothetical protein